MHKINLRELYPDMYKTDTFLEVTDEVQAVFLSDKRAEAAHERQMYRYKAQYSLDCDNGQAPAAGEADGIIMETRKGVALSYAPERLAV